MDRISDNPLWFVYYTTHTTLKLFGSEGKIATNKIELEGKDSFGGKTLYAFIEN